MSIGIWTPFRAAGPLGFPEELPLGRAALRLLDRGVGVVIGQPDGIGTFAGVAAAPGRWVPCRGVAVDGVYDRFPSATQSEAFGAGLIQIGDVPVANPPWFTRLCRDKLRTQQQLERAGLRLPSVEAELGRFPERLGDWGIAFVKPRYGSFGRDVRRVRSVDDLPSSGEWVLQRAVPAPAGWAGVSVRVLVQRVGPAVASRTPVIRRSREDAVVNAARGADLVPGSDLKEVRSLAIEAFEALANDDPRVVEAGIDAVLDGDGRPHLIEVNSRPRGRLRALAGRWPDAFGAEHLEACVAPLLALCT